MAPAICQQSFGLPPRVLEHSRNPGRPEHRRREGRGAGEVGCGRGFFSPGELMVCMGLPPIPQKHCSILACNWHILVQFYRTSVKYCWMIPHSSSLRGDIEQNAGWPGDWQHAKVKGQKAGRPAKSGRGWQPQFNSYTLPVAAFFWMARPGLAGRFACGRRKRTARPSPTGSGQSKRTQPVLLKLPFALTESVSGCIRPTSRPVCSFCRNFRRIEL